MIENGEIAGETTDFVIVMILQMTYAQLTKIAKKKHCTVGQVIGDALSKYIVEET